MLSLDPDKPVIAFDEPPMDWGSEIRVESILKHMGFNGGYPNVLTLRDAEILHEILFRYTRKPPESEAAQARLAALRRRIGSIRYVRGISREGVEQDAAIPSVKAIFGRSESDRTLHEQEAPEGFQEPPPPSPDEPEPLPPAPPDSPEPEIPPISLPPPPPQEMESEATEDEQPRMQPPLEVVAKAQELEQLQAEIQRLSMLKNQMERQRDEVQNMLQVERSALEEREVLVTAQAATLQSRANELERKEKDLGSKSGEMARQKLRLELMEFLVSISGLEKKDFQIIRSNFKDLESLRAASLDDLLAMGQLGESKSRELYAALHPNWSGEQDDLGTRAQALLEVGDHHGALECYEFMLRNSPESESLWFNKAEVLSMLGDREGALQAYSRVLELNDGNVVAWREKADLLFEASRIEEGIRALRSLIGIDGNQTEVVLAKAAGLGSQGNDKDAILLYNAVLESDPGNVDAHLGLGDCLLKLGDYDMADKMYTRGLGRDPQNPRALYKKGSMLDRRGRWGAALQLFNRAIALDWNYTAPWVGKGEILLKQSKPSEALDCFHKAIEFNPDLVEAWVGKIKVHLARGEVEEAGAAQGKVRELDPENEALAELGSILAQGKHQEKNETRRVLISEDSADILKNVLKSSKTISESQIIRRLADMALDSGDFDEALKNYSHALELDSEDVDAWCGMGLTLRKLGRMKEAWEAYNRALRIAPNREDAKRGRDACARKEVAY